MMKMSLDNTTGLNLIQAYTDGQAKIQGITYNTSLLVLPTELVTDWPAQNITGLDSVAVRHIAQHAPEIVILGTGRQQHFPDPRLLIPLMEANIGYEVMDNAAACRTFNILIGEGRKAALALLADV